MICTYLVLSTVVAQGVGREEFSLHDLAHVSWVGYVLSMQISAQPLSTVREELRNYNNSRSSIGSSTVPRRQIDHDLAEAYS